MIPKFRARDQRGNWHIGLLTFMFGQYAIVNEADENTVYLIDKETIGQSIGLKDKNGVEIFEGDLVEHDDNINGTWETFEACEIVYDGDYAQFCFKNDASNFLSYYRNLCIIGNIHENPELLEVAE
ncbi:YopX family protein [Enterococcus faecalis]|uniref:YopX family protein n=1 Tax=Enterococcus faecalis TaxID=1351 RepID=UPI00200FA952|nr:YopX family protein [Enterococcus faecalis]MCO5445479.1 YopX family protein [Enterococcus faecalis]UQF52583.1 YopX family protein [Enterococcus faecalis]